MVVAMNVARPAMGRNFLSTQETQLHNKSLDGDPRKDLAYWRERLAGAPPALELRADRPRSPLSKARWAVESRVYPSALTLAAQDLAEQHGCPFFAVLLTVFQVLLSRYTAQEDVLIGIAIPEQSGGGDPAGRNHRIAATRTSLEDNPTFAQLLSRVADDLRHDMGHQTLSFERVITMLKPERNTTTDPLFRVLFSAHPSASQHNPAGRIPDMLLSTNVPGLDLQAELSYGNSGIDARFVFNAELFDRSTISHFADHFHTLLNNLVADLNRRTSTVELLTASERYQILNEWNNTDSDYPRNACLHELFERQAARTPGASAVLFEGRNVTYRELNDRASQIANHLLALGVEPETLVGICVERSADMIAGLLGILKAGGAYVPLDPQYPSSRLALMLQDSGLQVLITQERLQHNFAGFAGHFVCLDSQELVQESKRPCSGRAQPDNLAYVIYTSGSTGKPKGVAISNRALVNFLWSMRVTPGLTANDTLLAVTTTSFDIAGLELYLPLITGSRIALASRETAMDGYKLRDLIKTAAATVMQATPATWRLLLEAGWEGDPDLKILCGGEAFPQELAGQLLSRCSEVWNMYGPTETTIWSTISRVMCADNPISIGRPIANTFVYILDANGQPVPIGVPGELYIGGDGVAREYLHRPDLTAERFVANPFRKFDPGARMYRTGDLAYFRANGDIECLGRIDNQVKVRGFRIELGEIEAAIRDFPGVRQNVVVAREDTPGDKRLVAYVVMDSPKRSASNELRRFLKAKVPEYMLPAQIVFLQNLPLTPNGKIDRRALPMPQQDDVSDRACVVPRNDVEERLGKIWTSVLRVRSIGIQDNFFELGGHSLLVAKLIRRIEQAFDVRLSMASIFEASTIEQQSKLILNTSARPLLSGIIPVQSHGSKPPLFCFGINSGPMYLPLARHLGHDQPLLCVELAAADAEQLSAPYQLQEVVSRLVTQVRERQPKGPYYLSGCCAGGLMAFEAARQLAGQGQEIALLALLEPHIPVRPADYSGAFHLKIALQKLRFHLSNLLHLRTTARWGYIHDRFLTASLLRVQSLPLLLRGRHSRTRDLAQVLYLACRAYEPGLFTGRLLLLHTSRRQPGSNWELEYWNEYASAVERRAVPGYSNWVVYSFAEPNVGMLAQELRNYLEPTAQAPEERECISA
jgi:amino acid adenylation domain-containing protein